MKAKRIIVGAVAAIVALALCASVCVIWHNNGCEFKSLIMACMWYIACTASVWMVIDEKIRESGAK